MEPKIDTIEIGDDSDEETPGEDKSNKTDDAGACDDNTTPAVETPAPPKIKEEPDDHIEDLDPDEPDNGLNNVRIIAATHVTTAEIVDNDVAQLDLIDSCKDTPEIVLDERSKDGDIEIVPSPDIAEDNVSSVQCLETAELVPDSPEFSDNQDLAEGDLESTKNADDISMMATDSNTNIANLITPKEGSINQNLAFAKESDVAVSAQDEPLYIPDLRAETQCFETTKLLPASPEVNADKQNAVVGDLESTTVNSDDVNMSCTELNTNETDLDVPESEIKTEPSVAEELIDATNNICILETRSLTHENTHSEATDKIVKTEHTVEEVSEEKTISEENTGLTVNGLTNENIVNLEIKAEKPIEDDSDIITTNNIEINNARNGNPDLIYARTLDEAVAISNEGIQTTDFEEDIIMYDAPENIEKATENIVPPNAIENIKPNDVNIVAAKEWDDSEPMEIVDDGVDDGEYLDDDGEYIADEEFASGEFLVYLKKSLRILSLTVQGIFNNQIMILNNLCCTSLAKLKWFCLFPIHFKVDQLIYFYGKQKLFITIVIETHSLLKTKVMLL